MDVDMLAAFSLELEDHGQPGKLQGQSGGDAVTESIVPLAPCNLGSQATNQNRALAKKGKATKCEASNNPCWICGRLYSLMPCKSRYCFQHECAVASMTGLWKPRKGVTEDQNPHKAQWDLFQTLLKDKKPPPSRLSAFVFKYEDDCPPVGIGKSRGWFDLVQCFELHYAEQSMERGFEGEYMCFSEFCEWAVFKKKAKNAGEAKELWQKYVFEAAVEDTDQNGPADEPLRILIHIRDFVIGKRKVSHQKGLMVKGKDKKIPDDPDKLREMQSFTTHGYEEMSGEAFAGVGASFAARLALQGHKIAGSTGEPDGVSGSSETREVESILANKKALTNLKASPTKKTSVDKQALEFFQRIEQVLKPGSVLKKLEESVNDDVQKANDVFCHGQDDVPHSVDYHAIMKRRLVFWQGLTEPQGVTSETDANGIQSLVSVKNLLVAVESIHLSQDAPEAKQQRSKIELDGAKNTQQREVQWVLAIDGMECDNFATKLVALVEALKLLYASRHHDLDMKKITEQSNTKREPLPTESIGNLLPSALIEFWKRVAKHLTDPEVIVELEASLNQHVAAVKSLAAAVKQSAKDVQLCITRDQAKRADQASKSVLQAQKEAEKAKRKADNVKAQEAKRARKLTSGVALLPASAQNPEAEHRTMAVACLRVREKGTLVTEFESLQQLSEAITTGKFKLSDSQPFVIKKSEQLAKLCDERSVKAAVGAYKVQFPVGAQAQGANKRGQRPFTCDKRGQVAELLLEAAPVKQKFNTKHESVLNILSTVSIWGCLETCDCCSIDRNGLGNIRYQIQGRREVCVCGYSSLKRLAVGKDFGETKDPIEVAEQVMKGIKSEDLEGSERVQMHHCVLEPGQLLVTPMASFVAERVVPNVSLNGAGSSKNDVKDSYCVGFRAHWLEDEKSAGYASFKSLYEDYVENLKAMARTNDQTSVFWSKIIEMTIGNPDVAAGTEAANGVTTS